MTEIERCQNCDEPTGRAGLGDDSLSVTLLDGVAHEPLCEECFAMFEKERLKLCRGSAL